LQIEAKLEQLDLEEKGKEKKKEKRKEKKKEKEPVVEFFVEPDFKKKMEGAGRILEQGKIFELLQPLSGKPLGVGGQAIVWKAQFDEIESVCCLKIDKSNTEYGIRRLKREATTLKTLNEKNVSNIPKLLAVDLNEAWIQEGDNKKQGLVIEFIPGATLASIQPDQKR